MADAKIINYGQQINAGTTAIPDNNSTALDIESTDGKDYIVVDTTDSHETINIGSGATSSDVCHVSIGSSPGSIGEILRVRQNHTSDSLVLLENTGAGIALDLQSNRSSGDVVTLKNNSGGIFASFDADHALKLNNPTHENTDGGRESTVRFSGEKADGTAHDLARIESRHDGSSDDTKGEFVISTNNGTALKESLVINSDGNLGIVTNSADAVSKSLIFKKSRDTTDGSADTIVQDNDVLGEIEFKGANGAGAADANFSSGAKIFARVNATPGDDSMPTELVFATSGSGTETPSERVYIRQNGNVGVNDNVPNYQLANVGNKSVPLLLSSNSSTNAIGTDYASLPDGSAAAIFDHRTGDSIYLQNNTTENTADGRETGIGFFGRVNLSTDEYHYQGAIRCKHEGSSADQKGYLTFYTNSGADNRSIEESMRITSGGNVYTTSKPLTALTSGTVSTSGSSTTLNGSSTVFHDDFHVGAAIRVGSVTTTVTAIANATTLTLEDAIETGVTGTTCTRDGGEMFAVKTADSKTLFSVTATGAIQAGSAAADSSVSNNLAIGDSDALNLITQHTSPGGNRNYIFGHSSDNFKLSTGQLNCIMGYASGEDLTSGQKNTILGCYAGGALSSAQDVTAIGYSAGGASTGNYTTLIGRDAGSTASHNNVAVGHSAMSAFTGADSVAIGKEALDASGSLYSTAVGYQSLTGLTGGALESNSAFGYRSGLGLDTGQQCLFLGSEADTTDVDGNNQIAIGHGAVVDAPNTMVLGNYSLVLIRPGSTGNVELGNGSYEWDDVFTEQLTESSDARVKEDIQDTSLGLDFINRLRPVNYKLKDTPREVKTVVHTDQDTYVNDEGEEVIETRTRESEVVIHPGSTHTRKHEGLIAQEVRSEERRVGKECRSRWSPYH